MPHKTGNINEIEVLIKEVTIQDQDCWIMKKEALRSFETSIGHNSEEMQLLECPK